MPKTSWIRLAVLVELRLVRDGQADTGPWLVYRGCIASHGKKGEN